MTTMNHDDDIYKSQPLVLPAKVNTSEIERIRDILLSHVHELDEVIEMSQRKPKSALRRCMASIAALRKVFTTAEVQGARAWVLVGMKKTELARIIDRPRTTIDRNLKKDVNFESDLTEAQRQHEEFIASEQSQRESAVDGDDVTDDGSKQPEDTKKTPPDFRGVNPYDDSDYEDV